MEDQSIKIAELEALISHLQAEILLLRAENEELKARLAQNSTNSSKPPASDGLQKKTIKPGLPRETGRKPGGQKDHPGHTLVMTPTPDEVIEHRPTHCATCGRALPEATATTHQVRQVFDLPNPRLEVTEHRQMAVHCCCGCQTLGAFPALVTAPVQYGPRLHAQSILLNVDYKVPFVKLSRFWADLTTYPYNPATLMRVQETFCEQLRPIEAQIKAQLEVAHVVHFDETGLRVKGKLAWLHVASTALWTYLFVHPKRGQEALKSAQSVYEQCTNWLVHDCLAAYFAAGQGQHALCGAHLLRELQGQIEQGRTWAVAMQTYLLALYAASRGGPLAANERRSWLATYRQLCEQGLEEEPGPIVFYAPDGKRLTRRPKQTSGRNLLDRLVLHESAVLAFGFEAGVPFTNNEAERSLRSAKVKQKVSGSFRTEAGGARYARMNGFMSTLRKQGYNVVEQIANVLTGQFQWRA